MAHNVDRWALLCNLEGMILISSITDFHYRFFFWELGRVEFDSLIL